MLIGLKDHFCSEHLGFAFQGKQVRVERSVHFQPDFATVLPRVSPKRSRWRDLWLRHLEQTWPCWVLQALVQKVSINCWSFASFLCTASIKFCYCARPTSYAATGLQSHSCWLQVVSLDFEVTRVPGVPRESLQSRSSSQPLEALRAVLHPGGMEIMCEM